jgi:ribosomal protein S20
MVGCGKRPRNKIYIVSQRRQITGDKITNAKKTYEKLLRREQHEGKTAWLDDAMTKATARLKKMGLNGLIKKA